MGAVDPPDELAARRLERLRAQDLPVIECAAPGCRRAEALRPTTEHPDAVEAPAGWFLRVGDDGRARAWCPNHEAEALSDGR
jgi:hypothetical protein